MNKDLYFDENYGKLYENTENGKAEIFKYEDENGVVSNQFIKRNIPMIQDYYDIVTPYGYGGPIIEESKNKEILLQNYNEAFKRYCEKNNI